MWSWVRLTLSNRPLFVGFGVVEFLCRNISRYPVALDCEAKFYGTAKDNVIIRVVLPVAENLTCNKLGLQS